MQLGFVNSVIKVVQLCSYAVGIRQFSNKSCAVVQLGFVITLRCAH